MTEKHLSLITFYKGWDLYQQHLITAITPLTTEQLALRVSPQHWSIGMLAAHIVATRAGWFHLWMGEGSAELATIATWDESEEPALTATELVTGLDTTWQVIQDALTRWTPDDLEQTFQRRPDSEGYSRQWIIWHVLEHDLHHGGEISQALGAHGLVGIDL